MNSRSLPTGTVTFLFTDIEGSTKLAQQYPEAMPTLLARHHAILNQSIQTNNGYVFQIVGDSFAVAFHAADDALNAALNAQHVLQNESWTPAPIKVRMGIHTGVAQLNDDNQYSGYATLASTQRIMSAGHGGQILLSSATRELLRDKLPENTELKDLGEKRLKDLLRLEHLYQLNIVGLPTTFPPLKTLDSFPNNLPTQLTTFIGRENEIAEVKQELELHRLVTLTGSGGTGKTRLSLQIAADLLETFDHGVWFVELAPLTNSDLIPQTILSTIGVQEQQGKTPLDVLKEYLHEKQILIVLDNCEHLISASAQIANVLLNVAPRLKILASSREALAVNGEASYPVPSLSLPDVKHLPIIEQLSQYESVRLFIDRALLVAPHFVVDKDNAPHIAQICYRLDGIPLAIELATARIKVLSIEQISKRLDDRFRLLTGGARTALPRQQTLRAMIDWSYDLLSEHERLLLRRLAVFMGGWTLELAEQVCSGDKIVSFEVLDMLSKLVDKSLVDVVEEKSGIRYRILETVRLYAREKLFESGEGEQIRDRHLQTLLDLAERAEPEIRSANQLFWLDRLDQEIDNLRAALEWSQARDNESFLRLVSALWRFWDFRSYNSDAHEWFTQAITLSEGVRTVLRSRLLSRASAFYRNEVEHRKSLQLAQEASALAGDLNDKASLALALGIEGDLRLNEPLIAQSLIEESLRISEELGDHWLACTGWYTLAWLAERQNKADLVLYRLQRGLAEARLSGDHRRISGGLGYLSIYYSFAGKFAQAEEVIHEGLALSRQIGDKDIVAQRLMNLATVDIYLEKYSEAEALLLEAHKTFEEIGTNANLADAILGLANLAWAKNDLAQFTQLSNEGLRIAKQTEPRYVLTYAFLLYGFAAFLNHEHQLAREEFTETIRSARKENINWYYGLSIVGFGLVAESEGDLERAARILGAYEQLSSTLPPEFPFVVHKIYEAMDLVRAKLGKERFEIFAAQGRGMSLEQIIAFVSGELHE